MTYGTRFKGHVPEADTPGKFQPLPWGEYIGQFTAVKEHDNGDLEFTLAIDAPSAFKDRTVSFINVYCGEKRKDGSSRSGDYVERMAKHVAKLIETQGYADLVLNPKLKGTHKPIEQFPSAEAFKARKFVAVIGQEEYTNSSGERKVKNTLDDFRWWDAATAPKGPDPVQKEPRRDNRAPKAAQPEAYQSLDYTGTGAEHDKGPDGDYPGGYARSTEEMGESQGGNTPPWVSGQ